MKGKRTTKRALKGAVSALLLCCAVAFFGISSAFADDYIPPNLIRVTTPVYQPSLSDFNQPLGTYTYTVSWEAIPAATLTFNISQEGLYYKMTAVADTYRAIKLLYNLHYEAKGVISAVDLMPLSTVIQQTENSKRKFTEITYLENGEVQSFRQTNDKTPSVLKFNPENFMLEPFSAAFMARALPWQLGETKDFDTFNGKSRYLISLTAVDRIQVKVNNVDRWVWVFSPKVVNLSNAQQSKKLREARIYMTDDSERAILEIVSSVFIGSVYTSLDSFTPAGTVAPVHVALNR